MSAKARAVVYARVSTEMQAEDQIPIIGQVEECRNFCESKGWQIVYLYKDEGLSGSTADRPGLQELLHCVRQKPREIDYVVTWKGSRLARNVEDRLAIESLLMRNSIELVTVAEPTFEGSMKTLMVPILAAVDEHALDVISEDTKRGLKELARQGFSTGGMPPKGYRAVRCVVGLKRNGEPLFRTKWEPDPEWKGRALRAFEMLVDGCSSADIIRETGVVKEPSGISTYFRNPTFIGERVFNVNRRKTRKSPVVKHRLDDPDVIRVPNAHEAIIPKDLFDKAQLILEKRRPGPGQIRVQKHDFVLSGLLWCERHQCTMTGTGNNKRKYYACETFRRGGRKNSDCALLKKESLEKFIIDLLKEKVFTQERITDAIKCLFETSRAESKTAQREIASLNGKINKLQNEIANLMKVLSDGFDSVSVREAVEEREKSVVTLQKEVQAIKAKKDRYANAQLTQELIEAVHRESIQALDTEEPEKLRVILRHYIESIKVNGDSVSVKFAFQESPSSCRVMVAGGLLQYLATSSFSFILPTFVKAEIRLR